MVNGCQGIVRLQDLADTRDRRRQVTNWGSFPLVGLMIDSGLERQICSFARDGQQNALRRGAGQ